MDANQQRRRRICSPVEGDESLRNRKELFLVYLCQSYRQAAKIKLHTRASSLQERYIKNIKITQLPIIPCSTSTAYKSQEETLESEVVVDWKSEKRIINKRQQAYLMLNRCRTRDALITLNQFSKYLAQWLVPDNEVLEGEDKRLKLLHIILIKNYELN